MKKKYIELNTENIEEYTNKCKDILSANIESKKEYMVNANLYNNNLSIVNKDLSYILIRIEKIINEIRELSKRISSLEKGSVFLAYNHNQLLSKNNIDNNKINNARFFYNEIKLELNSLISRRDELKDILKWHKRKKGMLISQKKHFSKHLNKCVKNVKVCNDNIDSCYNVLNKIDNIYFYKSDKIKESFFIPKVKKK